jgi:large subunit ribosomal protein L13
MEIDAANKILGRLASEIAKILQGKHKADFKACQPGNEIIEVKNADKIKISGKKIKQKIYYHYSGYPGGLKELTLEEFFKKNPNEVLKRAVLGMLPKNKLQKERLKRLKFIS